MTIVVHPTNGRITRDDVKTHRPAATVRQPADADDVRSALESADPPRILVTNNDSWRTEYLDGLEDGDWVAATATGTDIYPKDRFEEHGITLTNMPTIYDEAVSNHAFAMAFSVIRRLGDYRDNQHDAIWNREKAGMTDFAGDVCCVVGMGRIGETIAERASAFGMIVHGVKRTVEGYDGAADVVYPSEAIDEAMDGARLAIVIVPLTSETRGLVGPEALSVLDDDAILVNVARGPVVDTDALLDALDSGGLRSACLDVFDEEPLPAKSPLWDRDDVLITPHVAGWSEKLPGRSLAVFLDQYDAHVAGEPLPHRVV